MSEGGQSDYRRNGARRPPPIPPDEDEWINFPVGEEELRKVLNRPIGINSLISKSLSRYVHDATVDEAWRQLVLVVRCASDKGSLATFAVTVGEPFFQEHWDTLIPRLKEVEDIEGMQYFMRGVLLSNVPQRVHDAKREFIKDVGP